MIKSEKQDYYKKKETLKYIKKQKKLKDKEEVAKEVSNKTPESAVSE